MSFGMFWPLFFLILIPGIILLYLLKQKAEDSYFSSLLLWKEAYKNIEATTFWEKLKKNLLLFLQILITLLLILSLMSPYLKSGGSVYQNAVLVFDTSGSMNSLYAGASTRLEEAKKQAAGYVDSLPEGTAITLISCSNEAKIEASNIIDKIEAKKKIKNIEPTDIAGDLNRSMSLLNSVVNQWENYEAVLLTDTPIDAGTINAAMIDLYTEGINASIDYVSHGYEKDKMTVLTKVTNHSALEFTTDINLYGDDSLLDVRQITLAAGESQVLYFEDVKFDGSLLKAEINEKDQLFSDNVGYDLVEEIKTNRVLLVTKSNVFLEKSLQTVSGITLYKTNDPENIKESDEYDLYIFDGMEPDVLPQKGNILYLNPESGHGFEVKGESSGVLLSTTAGAITEYISGHSFGVNKVKNITKPVWADSFITAGEYSAGFYGTYEDRKTGVIAFDLHHSDFPLQPEFPVLISNLMNEMLKSSILANQKFQAGSSIDLYKNIEGNSFLVTDPGGEKQELKADQVMKTYTHTQSAGVYSVAHKVLDETIRERFIVEFPVESESFVERNTEFVKNANDNISETASGRELKNILILLVLVVLIGEWIAYIREQ